MDKFSWLENLDLNQNYMKKFLAIMWSVVFILSGFIIIFDFLQKMVKLMDNPLSETIILIIFWGGLLTLSKWSRWVDKNMK